MSMFKVLKEASSLVSQLQPKQNQNQHPQQYQQQYAQPGQPGHPGQPAGYQQYPQQPYPQQYPQQYPPQHYPQQYPQQPGAYGQPPLQHVQQAPVQQQQTQVPGQQQPLITPPLDGQPVQLVPPPAALDNDPGEVVETMGNGTVIRKYKDGHKATVHADGTIEHRYLDGSTKTVYPNGQVNFYTPTVAKEDYVDKVFAKGAKHFGIHLSRERQEKITDAGRAKFEQITGKKVSAKISN